MLKIKKSIIGVVVLVLLLGGGVYVFLARSDNERPSSNEENSSSVEEGIEEADTRPLVAEYKYPSIEDTLSRDVPDEDKFVLLSTAGAGNIFDNNFDAGIEYLLAALEISNDEVDARDIQGTKDFLVRIAKTEEILEANRVKIIDLVGQEAFDSYEVENNSDEI